MVVYSPYSLYSGLSFFVLPLYLIIGFMMIAIILKMK